MKQSGAPEASPVPKRNSSSNQLSQSSDPHASRGQPGAVPEADSQIGNDRGSDVDSFGQLKIAKT